MSGPIIRVINLRKTFQMGDSLVHALDGVSVDIQPGTFNVLMGPSGSGKSTLLYLLGGLDRPTSGQIIMAGKAIEAMDENELAVHRRQQIGFVFQSFNLVPSMTALDNVGFPMRFANMPKARRDEVALKYLQRVGLAERAFHKPSELSGGQQQRVAVARALVNDPQIILADEPTGNLDTSSGAAVMGLLADLNREGRTIVVVTHDPRVRNYATDLIHILDGRIVDEATYEAAVSFQPGEGAIV